MIKYKLLIIALACVSIAFVSSSETYACPMVASSSCTVVDGQPRVSVTWSSDSLDPIDYPENSKILVRIDDRTPGRNWYNPEFDIAWGTDSADYPGDLLSAGTWNFPYTGSPAILFDTTYRVDVALFRPDNNTNVCISPFTEVRCVSADSSAVGGGGTPTTLPNTSSISNWGIVELLLGFVFVGIGVTYVFISRIGAKRTVVLTRQNV